MNNFTFSHSLYKMRSTLTQWRTRRLLSQLETHRLKDIGINRWELKMNGYVCQKDTL